MGNLEVVRNHTNQRGMNEVDKKIKILSTEGDDLQDMNFAMRTL